MNEIIDELVDGTLDISWYSTRECTKKREKVVKKHPENIVCLDKIEEYRRDIKNIAEECAKWKTFIDTFKKNLNINKTLFPQPILPKEVKPHSNEMFMSMVEMIARDKNTLSVSV